MESEAKGEPMTEPTTIYAPWTAEQVAQLNAWQKRSDRHPFTCGNDSQHYPLVAMRDGWICADCGYRQNWAHSMMTEPKANDHSWYGVPEQLTVCEPTYREGVYLAMSRSETHNMTEPKIPMITRIQLEGLREQITGWRETLNTYPDDAWAHEVCGKTLDAIRLALRALDAEQQIAEARINEHLAIKARDSYCAERNEAYGEVGHWKERAVRAEQQIATLTAERDEAERVLRNNTRSVAEDRDQFFAEKDQWRQERLTLIAERDQMRVERDALREKLRELNRAAQRDEDILLGSWLQANFFFLADAPKEGQ